MAAAMTTPNTLLGTFQPRSQTARLLSNVVLVVLGTLILAAAAKFKVPLPPVPFTLQSLAVAALAAAFGWRIGVATVALYIIEGLSGLPVFASGGGPAYLMNPSFGFILGWLPMSLVIGWAADRGMAGNVALLFATMVVADAISFALGFGWLMYVANSIQSSGGELPSWLKGGDLLTVAYNGAVKPFVLWDLLKMAFAAMTVAGLFAAFRKRT
jgi:biotin transport system substrate-specific component